MKRYFLMALLAGLIILPGCKKTAFERSSNFFAKQLKVAESVVGKNHSDVENTLKKNGWAYSESFSDPSEGMKAYTSNNYLGIVYVLYHIISYDEATSELEYGKAMAVYFNFYNNYATELTDETTYREFISLLGESPKINNVEFKFLVYESSKGDGETFSDFVTNFSKIFAGGSWTADWWADKGKDSTYSLSFGHDSEMTVLGLIMYSIEE